ncbi:uncharacterized protein [Mytilus edulis]|uniref:uncharacterized protein n=1 Tax=Mytilus edulis TaxID=6550 RepID=UPI0039EF6FC4
MPRRGSKKSDLTKRKEQRDRMRDRRVKQTDDKNLISTVNQSDTSLNCPINNDQSVISQNCPIHNDQSVISQNCPIHNDQSVISQNCPINNDQSLNSLNCPIQQDQSLNSINCPINIDQSINSINCFISNDQSVNSLNCPFEQDQSVNSINYPTNNFQSVNSINCSTNNDQSVNSINCSTNNDQSVNSINCFTNNDQSVNSLNCPYDTETIKLNPSIKSESNRSIKSESTISIKLNKTTKSIKLNKLMKSKVDPESSTSKLDYESVESIKNNLDNESVRINLDFESVETNYAFESNGTNLDYEVVNRTLDNEKVESNLGYESRKSKQSSKSTYNLKETMVSNLNDTIQLGTNLEKKSSDAKNEHTNSLEFLKNIGSIINEKENIQMDFNDFLEFEQDDNLLKLYSQRNKRTIPENSIEARRSLFDNWVVQGSFHQGDIRFGINSGKQCVANCLSALAHSKFKDLNDWNQIYLDNVLIDGNRIYSRIHGDNIHLLVSDLPDMIDMSGMLLKISRKESITAVVDTSGTINFSEFGNSLPLDQALQESLIDYDACFICAYDTTFLALKHNQDLLLFDSHARNKLGFKDSDGKSLLLKLSNLDHLYQYCCNMMAGASQNQWFEVTGVSICIFGQEPKIKTNDELSGSHKPLITSEFKLSEILETVNKDEIPKSQENITQISNISPEILQLNICSNDIENVNEVHINEVINDDESDIEILSTAECFYDFIPLKTLLKRKLCKFVNIPSKKISKQNSTNFYNIGQPTACKTISGDGNCLFRAISYSLSNRQEYFGDIRRAIVDHLLRNAEVFKSFLQPRFKTVEEHIQTLRMEENNVWGTELEIVACADLLKTDIYTFFNGTWIKYSSSQINSNNCVNDQAIYLQHNGDINHYEVVTAVKQKTISPNGLQSKQEHEYDISRKSEVSTKKMKIDENQMNDSLNNTDSKVLKNEKEKIRYMTDDKFRARKIDTSKRKYQENEGIRSKKICSGIKKYEEDEDYKNILIQAGIEKYKEDNEYREKLKQASIHKYKANEKHKEHVKQESIHKYKTDDKHKEHVIQESIHKYKTDEKHKEHVKHESIHKYKTDEKHKEHVKQESIHKYKTDEKHKEHVKQESMHKYKTDEKHKEHVKQESIHKYKTDEKHKEHVKQESIHKYNTDENHKKHVKQESIHKYKTDEKHKEHVKQASIHKYANDDAHRIKIKQQTSVRRENLQVENKQINEVIRKFKVEVNKGPECVCACCLRLFFEKQVQICKKEYYDNSIFDLVTTDKYQHKCTDDCKTNCAFEGTCRTSLWICYTCHRKMLKGKIPADSFSNSLLLEDVPVELKQLNSIEQQLIAQNIPFMKIMALPKGGQKGVHGPVVCVPSDLKKVTSILPRSEDESLLLKVKLKRKLSYKGYDKYQFVRPNHLEQALLYLKDQNIWYKDVAINKEWLNPIPELNDDQVVDDESESDDTELLRENIKEEEKNKTTSSTTGNEREIESEPASYIDDRLRGVQLDTCLQPADIGQEALDLCFDQVFNIAPAENNSPLSVLQESGIEAKTFPVHFPTGKNTFDEIREEKLTIGRYFNLRLMSVENRFARDTSYIFFSQYLTELNNVISNVQISLRKECPFSKEGNKITGEMLCNKETLKELFKKDEAIKYLKPIRGTPPYWQSSQKDIFAMIRQLGVPTFFCSFSSADFRWSEIVNTILKQQGDIRNTENMTWDEKCKVLCSNPVTAARMFNNRFNTFLKDVIMSEAEPIGKIIDYFYRVEFQQRGSPHTHCLFWVENAPKYGEDNNEEVMSFIDKYVTCEIPDEKVDKELHDIVMAVHQHSKNHSKTCKKKGTVCRFNFPRPPSTKTFISEPSKPDKDTKKDEKVAKEILSGLWKVIKEHENENLDVSEIFNKSGLTQESFETYFRFITNRNTVVLKREPNEIYTNQYNPHLLRAWNANMDIQYILDAFSCVVYIISYISKSERELGLLLQQTKNEAEEGNLNAQQTMKQIGTSYLHHREVSAQEAVFRVTGLRLRECSRKVEYIPVGENPCRMSIPLKDLEKQQSYKSSNRKKSNNDSEDENDDENKIWMNNIVDRYKGRPHIAMFIKMCLASFGSEYSVLRESQLPQKINEETTFKLDGNLGHIRKRTRTSPAVIKYPRFSQETSPEKYFQSILQLFLPYRHDEQLKPPLFNTYENFFTCGRVKFTGDNALTSVKEIVIKNMADFVKTGQELEDAENQLHETDPKEDAWCELCPESELNRRECIDEGKVTSVIEEDLSEATIPDLNNAKSSSSVGTNLLSVSLTKNEIIPRLRSLNVKQRRILYKVRDWCIQKANGKIPKPLHVFITGGAGTGKSHLIKCIQYEATRILAQTLENPDDLTVLLTAPTGTAAFNIHGLTIHSALGIFKSLSADHATLSEDKINSLRTKLENLQILIIDEISMVNKKLLFFIHERLRQVKKRPDNCLFGGVSIIAVGDFYQLPPVRTKRVDKLYVNDPSNPSNHLWNGLFEIAELDEIMRQREDSLFAELLNRLRVKQKNEKLTSFDMETLIRCLDDGHDEALHIYSTNAEVDTFNKEMILKLCTEPKLIEAEDYEKNKTSGKLTLKKVHCTKSDVCLPISILLAEGARVMLIKNEDTADGLVNGVMGTVISIKDYSVNSLPSAIFVFFDNERVGKNAKLQKIICGKRCVGLKPSSEDIPLSTCVRKQFPLKLAWACTIHKVQGLTVEECVVDLNKCFTYGQAYVALSRVTSKSGLHIKSIETEKLDKKIFCDPDIVKGVAEMTRFLPEVEDEREEQKDIVQIMYHNIQGLQAHAEDLKQNPDVIGVDFICLTETWANQNFACFEMIGYDGFHLPRSQAFENDNSYYSSLKEMQHGGVCVFYKHSSETELCNLASNLECIIFKIKTENILVATIYRTQKYNVGKFLENLETLICKMQELSEKIVIIGDFNQDILKGYDTVLNFMQSKGFNQLVNSPTTEGGTLIDHVYVRGCLDISVAIMPTYYSYHEALRIVLKS